MASEEKSSVERLKGRLYARKKVTPKLGSERTPLSPQKYDAPVSWAPPISEPAPEKRPPLQAFESYSEKSSFATKFLIGSGLFFLGAMGVAAFVFFGGANIVSSRNIDLQVVIPSLIDGGKEAKLEIIIQNHNHTSLQLADLIIDYPEGTRDPEDLTRSLSHERQSIGSIGSGQEVKQTAQAVFYGSEGTQQKVHVTLEYTITGSNAVFVKESDAEFIIGSSPVSLSVEAPSEVIAGEAFPIEVKIQSNAATPVEHVLLEGQYPFGFSVLETSPSAEVGGLLWRLGTMEPGQTKIVRLTGVIDASEGDERVFRFLVGSDADETNTRIRVPFISQPTTLTVKRPFIGGTITLEGKSGKNISAPAGKELQGSIQWQNNLSEEVSNVELELVIEGPMLDTDSVSAQNGFYQSSNHSITWTKSQDPSLSQASPGGGGTLFFSFATNPPGSGGVVYTNPTINLNLTIQGTRQGEGGDTENVSSAATMQVSLSSNLSLAARALHFSGPFSNTGPMPPKAESETSYTILWSLRNSSNAVANAAVATVLPPYVRFVAASSGSGIVYDEASRTVRWELGDVGAGAGYSTPEKQASFQVVFTPSTSQVDQAPPLTGVALFTGQDRFAQVPVQASAEAPTTELRGDSGFKSGMGTVAPK